MVSGLNSVPDAVGLKVMLSGIIQGEGAWAPGRYDRPLRFWVADCRTGEQLETGPLELEVAVGRGSDRFKQRRKKDAV